MFSHHWLTQTRPNNCASGALCLKGLLVQVCELANLLNFNVIAKENLKMAQNQSSEVFRKYFVYGVLFGISLTLIAWFSFKFF